MFRKWEQAADNAKSEASNPHRKAVAAKKSGEQWEGSWSEQWGNTSPQGEISKFYLAKLY